MVSVCFMRMKCRAGERGLTSCNEGSRGERKERPSQQYWHGKTGDARWGWPWTHQELHRPCTSQTRARYLPADGNPTCSFHFCPSKMFPLRVKDTPSGRLTDKGLRFFLNSIGSLPSGIVARFGCQTVLRRGDEIRERCCEFSNFHSEPDGGRHGSMRRFTWVVNPLRRVVNRDDSLRIDIDHSKEVHWVSVVLVVESVQPSKHQTVHDTPTGPASIVTRSPTKAKHLLRCHTNLGSFFTALAFLAIVSSDRISSPLRAG